MFNPTGGPFDGDWNYRKKITINSSLVRGDQVNFPVLIQMTDSDLKNKARSDGKDIIFIQSDNETLMNFEIESYNSSNGNLIAWVSVPEISNMTNTEFYMYYGNSNAPDLTTPSGVWGPDYLFIHHLEESPTGSITDDSGNNNDASSTGSMTASDLVDGIIGKGVSFDGSDDALLSDGNVDLDTEFTISCWVKVNSMLQNMYAILTACSDERTLYLQDMFLTFMGNGEYFGDSIFIDKFYHLAISFNGSVLLGYINGQEQSESYTIQYTNYTDYYTIGALGQLGDLDNFDGIIDEARAVNAVRSSDWLETDYNSQNDSLNFTILGTEETINANANFEWVELYNKGSTDINLSGWSLIDNDGNLFNLTGAGILQSKNYLVCYIGQEGMNSTNKVYGPIINQSSSPLTMLENIDDLALLNKSNNIIDYLAWGSSPGSDDDDAVTEGHWTSNAYVETIPLSENETLGRDKDSTDTNSTIDRENSTTSIADPYGVDASEPTKGTRNIDIMIPEFKMLIDPILIFGIIILLFNKYFMLKSSHNIIKKVGKNRVKIIRKR
jgi:hypothetical protein